MHKSIEQARSIMNMSGVDTKKCMMCGKCSATCPAFDEMDYHPHQFVKMVTEGDIESLLAAKSLWKCLSCFACVERCPRGVEPANVVEALRVTLLRRQGESYITPEDVPELLDDKLPQQAIVSAFRKYKK